MTDSLVCDASWASASTPSSLQISAMEKAQSTSGLQPAEVNQELKDLRLFAQEEVGRLTREISTISEGHAVTETQLLKLKTELTEAAATTSLIQSTHIHDNPVCMPDATPEKMWQKQEATISAQVNDMEEKLSSIGSEVNVIAQKLQSEGAARQTVQAVVAGRGDNRRDSHCTTSIESLEKEMANMDQRMDSLQASVKGQL